MEALLMPWTAHGAGTICMSGQLAATIAYRDRITRMVSFETGPLYRCLATKEQLRPVERDFLVELPVHLADLPRELAMLQVSMFVSASSR